jgi:hypothetical protein
MLIPTLRSKRPIRPARSACFAVLASSIALAVAPISAAPTSAAATAAATHRCATSGLDIWFNNAAGGAAAGSTYYKLELTNLSGHACTLLGYPGVSAVNLSGHQVGKAGSRETSQTPHVVTLAAGATATAVLRIVDAGNFPATICHETTAAGLRVYPPGQTASRLVAFPFQACSDTGPGILSVRAVQK